MTKLKGLKTVLIVVSLCTTLASRASAQTFRVLANFDETNGAVPEYGSLAQGPDGNLYGSTLGGGNSNPGCSIDGGCGTLFRVTLAGELTAIYAFCSETSCPNGSQPVAGLLLDNDGYFYGTTSASLQGGTVFRTSEGGMLTTLYEFGGPNGETPYAGLVQGIDGTFYGTTVNGGTNQYGTVFNITKSGVLTTLHDFNSSDGKYPYSSLTQSTNGYFYGTAFNGGTNGLGTIFRISSSGEFEVLYNFCSMPNCADGSAPVGGLLLASDRQFYETTIGGGEDTCGTVFRMSTAGTVTIIHTFDNTDGCSPFGGLIEGTDGALYGTTCCGGVFGYGTIFTINPNGVLTTLHNFDENDGSGPAGALLQDTNGIFYGTTEHGGGFGDVFSLDMGFGPFVTFVRSFGKPGQTGGILGQGFTGTTNVAINGIPGSFTVVSDTFIRATVPAGAITGYVTVTTPSGTLTSNVPFHVIK